MADPDEALIEAIAESVLRCSCNHIGDYVVTMSDLSDEDQDAMREQARAAYAAMVEHLGLVEEHRHLCSCGGNWGSTQHYMTGEHNPLPPERRLVQLRWVEVDHGSE